MTYVPHGRRATALPAQVENDLIEAESVFATHDGQLRRMAGVPTRPERYTRAGIDLDRILATAEI